MGLPEWVRSVVREEWTTEVLDVDLLRASCTGTSRRRWWSSLAQRRPRRGEAELARLAARQSPRRIQTEHARRRRGEAPTRGGPGAPPGSRARRPSWLPARGGGGGPPGSALGGLPPTAEEPLPADAGARPSISCRPPPHYSQLPRPCRALCRQQARRRAGTCALRRADLVAAWNPRKPRSSSARMSCQTLTDDVAMNTGCIYGSSSSLDQLYRLLSKDGLSSDFAENSRVLFGNHTLLCELFKKRAEKKPSFLQRNLCYKIRAKQNKRIWITISLSGSSNAEVKAQNIFPLYALIAKPINTTLYEGHSPVYQFTRVCLLTCFDESGRNSHTEATFIIEDLKKANIILVSCGQFGQSPNENNCSKNQLKNSSLRKLGGQCFWGKIPNHLLYSSLENCVDLCLGQTKKFALPVTMRPGFGETKFLEKDSFLTFCSLKFNAVCPYELEVSIRAQTTGARHMFKSPYYNSYLHNDVPPSCLPHIVSLRNGNVRFKYGDNIFDATEVTEGFCCSFCYAKCGSFKGLEHHLMSSHDRLNFDFWISEKEQGVNVSLKHNTWRDEDFPAGIDPRQRTFSYFSKYKKRSRLVTATEVVVPSKDTEMIVPSKVTETIVPSKATKTIVLSKATETIRHGPLLGVGSKSPKDAHVTFEESYVQKEIGKSLSDMSVNPANSLYDGHLSPPRAIQFGMTRKLSVDQFDPKLRQVLRTRQFFHSHKGQQMTFEEVLSNHDSEDEIDDDVADFEDRMMLDSFDDITKDEKHFMHMWNSFVSRQRVIADNHIPYACKAFSQLHGQLLAQSPSLLWCWRLFMIKLWNHNLLNGNTMNACNLIIDGFKNQGSHPK